MVSLSIPKVFGVISCSVLLCLGLSGVALSTDTIGDTQPGKTIKGQVLRVEGDNYIFIKNEADGKVVRVHVDKTTVKSAAKVVPGDNVQVKFNDENHAISIMSDRSQSH